MGDINVLIPVALLWFCGGGLFWVSFLFLVGALVNAAKARKARRQGR
jgi:hypothetical protein